MCGRCTLTVQEQNLAAEFNLTVGDGGGYAIRYNIAPTQNVPVVRVVETPYNPPSTTVQPDVSDISALVNKFRNAPGAPIKARAFLAGEPGNAFGEITPAVLNVDFGFSHISACVDAFRGVPYPYTIAMCP